MSSLHQWVIFSGAHCLDVDAGAGDRAGLAESIAARRVPLVLCSGRTRAEVEHIQQRLGIADPFICEHGAAVFVRKNYFGDDLPGRARSAGDYDALEFGPPRTEVVRTVQLAAARSRASIVRFSEMSVAEVAAALSIPLLDARLAKLREYEEVFRVVDDDGTARRRVWRQLRWAQLGCISEGAFDFAGPPVDLGTGAQWLIALYRGQGSLMTVGIGDQLHHAPLLRRVDLPIIVPSHALTTRHLLAAAPRATLVEDREGRRLGDLLAPVLAQQSWSAAS